MTNFPITRGRYAPQAHVRVPEGAYELEYAREGFMSEEATHLYVEEPPSHWNRVEGDMQPRAIDGRKITPPDATDPYGTPAELFQASVWCGKKTLTIFLSKRQEKMPFVYRTVDGDEMHFVHQGHGRIDTEFGVIEYERGDYIYIPRGSLYRVLPESSDTFMITTESRMAFEIPNRGLLGPHAIFDKGVLRLPDFDAPREKWDQDEYEVRIKRLGHFSKIFYDFNPLTNVVGWKGNLTPFVLNVRDIRPMSSLNNHVVPSANTTFESEDAIITTFAPRAIGDEETLRLPFYHRNVDYDEFIFYHDGNFFSRGGIEPGMMTLHPAGLDHGPHPVAWERDRKAQEEANRSGKIRVAQETAINVDTTHALFCSQAAIEGEVKGYATSWYDQAKEIGFGQLTVDS